jgi:hypothetical protein
VATTRTHANSLSAWHTLELSFGCAVGGSGSGGQNDFTAVIDGTVVARGRANATAGMAGLSSGWHVAEFDRFNMSKCT